MFGGCLMFMILVLLIAIIDALWSCGLVWVLSKCFSFTFSWKLAIGVWVLNLLLAGIFRGDK